MKVLNACPDFRFQHWLCFAFVPAKTTSCLITTSALYHFTRKYMHAETLADKTIVFSEREVFKVVVMVTQ